MSSSTIYDQKEIENSEKSLLSSLIFYYSEIIETVDIHDIYPHYFSNKCAYIIFQALLECELKENKFDIFLLHNQIKTRCQDNALLKTIDKYLNSLTKEVQYYNVNKYLTILNEHYVKTELNNLSSQVLNTQLSSEQFHDVIASWENRFLEITTQNRSINYLSSSELIEQYEKNKLDPKHKVRFLKSCYAALDKKIQGFCPGTFLVIASRPGIGKTTFALNLINNNLKNLLTNEQGVKPATIGFFSLEMTNDSIFEKLMAINAQLPLSHIKSFAKEGEFEEYEKATYESSKALISSASILFCDQSNITIGKMLSTIKYWYRKYDLKVVIIDYLQLINIPNEKNMTNFNQHQKIGMISRHLKILSLELSVCIVALAQLNRKSEDRKTSDKSPILSDLRESGSIEQDADVVMFLYENNTKDPFEEINNIDASLSTKEITLKVGKNRHGPIGQINYTFEKETGRFTIDNNANQTFQ